MITSSDPPSFPPNLSVQLQNPSLLPMSCLNPISLALSNICTAYSDVQYFHLPILCGLASQKIIVLLLQWKQIQFVKYTYCRIRDRQLENFSFVQCSADYVIFYIHFRLMKIQPGFNASFFFLSLFGCCMCKESSYTTLFMCAFMRFVGLKVHKIEIYFGFDF